MNGNAHAGRLLLVAVLFICLLCSYLPLTYVSVRNNRVASPTRLLVRSDDTRALCDNVCLRLHRNVSSWSAEKPRGVIVMLVKLSSLNSFGQSIRMLHVNWNAEYRYPIIVFHEPELDDESRRDLFRSHAPDPSLLYFQRVIFEFPEFVNISAVPINACGNDVAYRHMCRFHAKTIYEQPILDPFRYVLRLDDDSFIASPIGYDVFQVMIDRSFVYGYALICRETEECIKGLWPAVDQYTSQLGIRQKTPWKRDQIYFNNFEVSDLELWRSDQYRDYVDHLDRLGGIYYTRWGDAPIKTIAVSMFASNEQIHHFNNFKYFHKGLNRFC